MAIEARNNLVESIARLGPWFHNIHLPGGIQTAPQHFLGDFPTRKWVAIAPHLPKNLAGWKCLDIGCNAGFYSIELAKRGASVIGIDSDPHYLAQARWITRTLRLRKPPSFLQMQIHELARMNRKFDLVLFMGVFYHLRYPALALDTVATKVKRLMIFQTLTMDTSPARPPVFRPKNDYSIEERDCFHENGWPKMAFIEKSYSNDRTNWWVPNHAAVLALLRSTGFQVIRRIAHEIYLCTPPAGGVAASRAWDIHEWETATGARNPANRIRRRAP